MCKLDLKDGWSPNLELFNGKSLLTSEPEMFLQTDASKCTRNKTLIIIASEIWDYLLSHKIMITAEHLSSSLNTQADYASRNVTDSSEWKLNPLIFRKICQRKGTPDMDLFASRLSHQVPEYIMALTPELTRKAIDALQQAWSHLYTYAFPPFSLIGMVLSKVLREEVRIIIVTPLWQSQPWYTSLLQLSVRNPIYCWTQWGISIQ